MLKLMKNDTFSWLLLIGLILLVLEISFFNGGLIVSLFFSIACIYLGGKKRSRTFWKLVFWIGWISLIITVLNMMTVKFLLLAALGFIALRFYQSKKQPSVITPTLNEAAANEEKNADPIKKKPLFENIMWGTQRTPDHAYEWNDVNIQCGIGNNVIDLSNTVVPKGEACIVIRTFIGKVQILIPYDMEVFVHHSAFAGSTKIFDIQEPRIINQTLTYQTADYDQADRKVKIVTSMITGDLEVKRI